jgi:O-antigen/teichoic acid export membrane protein
MTDSSMDKQSSESGVNPPLSLKKRAIRGSVWTLGSHALSQIIRLASNVALGYFLFPKAFGVMALIYTFTSGLEMLSDFGVRQNIIRSKRGDDPTFLNTAWTFQAVRGTLLWICSCLLAYPASMVYNEPLLASMLPVVALNILMSGFMSTNWATASRHLSFRRLTFLELSTQVLGTFGMVVAAAIVFYMKAPEDIAIWSLVIGGNVALLLRLILSHTYLEGIHNRFCWDKESLQELRGFGQWVFISTIMTFFALQGNNLIIPKLLGFSFFGVFSIAQTLSRSTIDVLNIVNDRVLFPSYSELVRERPERLYPVLRRARIAMNTMNLVLSLVFILLGKHIIQILYPKPAYLDAGWMLQILALGSLMTILGYSYMNVLPAQGRTFLMCLMMGIQVGIQFITIFVGNYLGGAYGTIVGIAAVGWVFYPVQVICFIRLKLWQPEVDIPFITLFVGAAALVFLGYV